MPGVVDFTGAKVRPRSINPLTFQEHVELAKELCGARGRLYELFQIVNEIYGPNSQATFTFRKTIDSLDRLCDDLRVQAGHDCPGVDTDGLYV